jgi:hypothetical protein
MDDYLEEFQAELKGLHGRPVARLKFDFRRREFGFPIAEQRRRLPESTGRRRDAPPVGTCPASWVANVSLPVDIRLTRHPTSAKLSSDLSNRCDASETASTHTNSSHNVALYSGHGSVGLRC